jgi:3-hydroxybutyryl-CoA dehydrogenase
LAGVYTFPEQVVCVNFFNPATVMQLVEVFKGFNTSESKIYFIINVAKNIGIQKVVADEYPEFVLNRIPTPNINEAMKININLLIP